MNPGVNPLQVVPVGDYVNFTLDIYNPGNGSAVAGAYLDIVVPQKWKFIQASETTSPTGNNTYRISGLDIPVSYTKSITITLQPLCDVVNGENKVEYNLYSAENAVLVSAESPFIGNIMTPVLKTDFPQNTAVVIGQREERTWKVTQTGNSYVKGLKVEISCDTTSIKFHDIMYKDSDGDYRTIGLDADHFIASAGKYTFYIDSEILNNITASGKLSLGDSIEIMEVISYEDCGKSGSMNYQVYYGDGTEWCLGAAAPNALSVPDISFSPWLEWIRTQHIPPTRSNGSNVETGRGKRLYRVANTATDSISVLRDLRAKFYNTTSYYVENSAYMNVITAYFTDADGNRIDGTPDIPVNTNGIPGESVNNLTKSYQRIVCFDEAGFTGNDLVPLVDYDNNGSFDDLPPGKSFFFAIEYDIQYEDFEWLPDPVKANDNGFMLFHRTLGELYYKNNCAVYKNYTLPANITFTNPATDPVYPEELKPVIGVSTNQGETVVGVGKPDATIDKVNVRPNDKVILSLSVPPFQPSVGRTGFLTETATNGTTNPDYPSNYRLISDDYQHTIKFTLPDGFIYDSSVGVRISNNPSITHGNIRTVAGSDITVEDNVLTVRNRLYFSGATYIFIGMRDNGDNQERINKELQSVFYFNFKDETPKDYAYHTSTIDYIQVFECSRIEMVSYDTERTTFGYTDTSMTQQADKNTAGINLQSAGPNDNVLHTALIAIKTDLTLDTDEHFNVQLSYASDQTEPYFIFFNPEKAVRLAFKPFGQSEFTLVDTLSATDVNGYITTSLVDTVHAVNLNLTSLVGNGATYVCNNIYFMHGAEIGQQQRLTYSKAHVQLNLGLEGSTQQTSQDIDDHLQFSAGQSGGELSRSKWHMLSLPLQKIVTGDLAFGDYPLTYLRKFEASAPESGTYLKGNWSSYFRTLNEPLNPAEGFILWVNKYDNKFKYQEYRKGVDPAITNQEREYGLKQLNGILELPFFEKEDMSTAHRVHRFDEATDISTFNYVMETASMPNYTEVTYNTENFNRGSNNEAYRFVSEMFAGHNVAHEVEVSPGMKFALVGNPYMSTLDFDAFYAGNSQYIKSSYQIWTEDGFSTYDPQGSSGKIMLDQYIAPMQSFLVELNDGVTTNFPLNFNVEDISVIRPEETNSKLRAKLFRQDKLDIRLVNDEGSILTYIARNEQGSDQLSDMDSRKIISALRTTPEVYSLKKDLSGQTAVSTNFVRSNDQTIPLGVATTWTGNMHLNFSGMDEYNASISLIDTETGTETDISGLTEYAYHFSYTPPKNASNQVEPDETRFFIRISSPVINGNEETLGNGQIIVYTKDNNICVLSSESNIIRQLYVYDAKGSILYTNQHVNNASYVIPGIDALAKQCVVKIVSDKEVKNTKIIFK